MIFPMPYLPPRSAPHPRPRPIQGSFGPGRGPMPVSPPTLPMGSFGPGQGPMPSPAPASLMAGSYGPGQGPMPRPGIENFRPPMAPPPGIEAFRPPVAIGNGNGPGSMVVSDERNKAKISPMEDPTATLRDYWRPVVDASTAETQPVNYSMSAHPGMDLRAAKGYAYDYKNPDAKGAAPGRHVGPMAQDLEHTVAKNAVITGPDGMKKVDTGRLALVNTAALAEEQKRLDRLEAIAKLRQPEPLPAPMARPQFAPMDMSALDAAYARQSRDMGPRY